MPTPLESFKQFLVTRETRALSWFSSWFLRTTRFVTTVVIEFQKDRCLTTATALTLTSLLSLVPLMSVFFSIFAAFPAFERIKQQIEGEIFETFIATAELRTTISQYLHDYTKASTNMEIINVVTLLVTSVLLFVSIEQAMSIIWGLRRRRGYYESVKAFSALMVLAPLLLAVSTYVSAMLSQTLSQQEYFREIAKNVWSLRLFRHGVSWLLFFVAYVMIPYTRVHIPSALLGSFVASNGWELAKKGFEVYLTQSAFNRTIYGQLSVIPIFLLWVYLSWLVFLMGAELAYCHQYRRALKYRTDSFDDENPPKSELSLLLFLELARRFDRGDGPVRLEVICHAVGIPVYMARDVFERLEDRRIVTCVDQGDLTYLPARSLSGLPVRDVYEALEPASFVTRIPARLASAVEVARLVDAVGECRRQVFADLRVGELVSRLAPSPKGAENGDDENGINGEAS